MIITFIALGNCSKTYVVYNIFNENENIDNLKPVILSIKANYSRNVQSNVYISVLNLVFIGHA